MSTERMIDNPAKQPQEALRWHGSVGGYLLLLDQTRLPTEVVELPCHSVEEVWQAIKRLAVRGAPAIGCAAAYGVCLGNPNLDDALEACDYLATSRPTAVNLFWALDRMRQAAKQAAGSPKFAERLLDAARTIHDQDRAMCTAIGRHGADLFASLPEGSNFLTHCNAGALATGGDGTALSVLFEIARRGRRPHVWVDETRPLLQGARLTAWELQQRGIDCTLICDSMAAQVMREGRVQAIVTGADRIAANGDSANKIGTYGVAVLAAAHKIPFAIAAPTSTFDFERATGEEIPIEERAGEEITHGFQTVTAPAGIAVYNPAFDVTPASLIQAIITDRGVIEPVSAEEVRRFFADP